MNNGRLIFFIVDQGGYPVRRIEQELRQRGFNVEIEYSMRKSITRLKQIRPDVVVTEFNTTTHFRDRISNLEPLLASLQRSHPDARLVVFLDQEEQAMLDRLRDRFTVHSTLYYPLEMDALVNELEQQARAENEQST
jgi:ActR/RegA family two-component response regulator